jgi:predicted amidohydrolase YtcJ
MFEALAVTDGEIVSIGAKDVALAITGDATNVIDFAG